MNNIAEAASSSAGTEDEEIVEIRKKLLHHLKTRSLILAGNESTWSTRGKSCSWLIDTRVLLLDPLTMSWISRLFWKRMKNVNDFKLACLEMTGIPLLAGIQSHGFQVGRHVNGVIVRKERKSNGRLRAIEG
ncbi:MAG: hypothetical protein PW789_00395 [Edaphobacter sp.]|uniref:hypothetical protein n=1 Tax=Edaphobacter sp. TaxID=1934404 RepID=UPI0023A31093|nr:hypothetical protein [Edaphobacter sp.]MDE1175050.1 hypothetical protein [Edaphobacter sp.]